MTRDTAERARELARVYVLNWVPGEGIEAWKALTALLTQIQAEARERLAAWMIERRFSTGHGDTFEDLLKELDWQVKELRGARLDGIRDAEAAFKEAYSEYEEPLIGVMYGMKAIAALAQALQPGEKEGK